jgi:hypothetical protein
LRAGAVAVLAIVALVALAAGISTFTGSTFAQSSPSVAATSVAPAAEPSPPQFTDQENCMYYVLEWLLEIENGSRTTTDVYYALVRTFWISSRAVAAFSSDVVMTPSLGRSLSDATPGRKARARHLRARRCRRNGPTLRIEAGQAPCSATRTIKDVLCPVDSNATL